jgi:hypothetical protein
VNLASVEVEGEASVTKLENIAGGETKVSREGDRRRETAAGNEVGVGKERCF